MDIRQQAASDTGVLHLRDANDNLLFDGEGDAAKPVTITIYGPGSKVHAKALARQSNQLIDRLKKKGKADQTAEEKLDQQAEFLAAITVSSENLSYGDLQGAEMYRAIYSDVSIGFIAEQVERFRAEWGNFSKGSPKN